MVPPMLPLPVDDVTTTLVEALSAHPNAVLIAPPGAGKTTRVPPALLRAPWLRPENPRILMLQPRRVAARAAAARLCEEQGWRLGEEAGYQVRFDNRTTPRTRLVVMTEGILARRIQADPFLEGVGCVLLDEFHERNIHSDLAIALLREIQTTVREDLRLLVMSATLDPAPVSAFLGGAPVIESRGRLFPVDVHYLERPSDAPCWELANGAVRRLLSMGPEGDLLVFLPGLGEIRRTAELLRDLDVELPILHSSVSAEEQDRALRPASRRKVVLATNIAETSLTIDGVRAVVDTGLARVLLHEPRLGLDRLELRRISMASARQRAGRAGRTGPGICLRTWTKTAEAAMEEADPPEIHRIDLAATLLSLKAYGARDATAFRWFDPPKPEAMARAEELLRLLGAAGEDGALSGRGRALARLPLHPRLGVLLLEGTAAGHAREAALVAALLSERDILSFSGGRRAPSWSSDCDLLLRLDALGGTGGGPPVDEGAARAVRRIARELMRLAGNLPGGKAEGAERGVAIRRALLAAFPDRVALRRGGDSSRGVMVGGRGVVLEPESAVREGDLFLALDPRDPPGGGGEARVRIASRIDADWLEEIHPALVETRLCHAVEGEKQRVTARRQWSFLGLVYREDPAPRRHDPAGAARALAGHIAGDMEAFALSDRETAAFLHRVRFLARARPEEGWPGYTREELEEALGEACQGRAAVEEVRGAPFRQALQARLDWRLRSRLDELAPEAVEVPSGSRIRLKYGEPGAEAPVLAARVQELFGLREIPRVAGGRVAVLLHLLGPNHRPVQVTTDLQSFWNGTYQEVRRELRARYPKHPWPEDPWSARAVAVGRRRGGGKNPR